MPIGPVPFHIALRRPLLCRVIAASVLIILAASVASRRLTPASVPSRPRPPIPSAAPPSRPGMRPDGAARWPRWPETRLEGQPAKELLLTWLESCQKTLQAVDGCTMIFRKQERIKGKLLPEQTYELKVRHHPFAVYMKSLSPVAGREVIFAEGQNDNDVIGHPAGMSRLLIPRLKVPPDHPLIMAESRHSPDQAGLANLVRKLIGFRKTDLAEPEAVTILDRAETPDGRKWLRSTHLHPVHHPGRPFAESEVLYDPETRLPLRFTGYDWPASGEKEPMLGERYCYDDLRLDVVFTDRDFDPANPDYSFHRF